ncbi:nucleotide disphospho-sugar-binding domain-containing protein [Tundrisphaera lichenicola]|uniref:nucleotide disphospho-sugar-binding domain-containing protein n=1 Tax=Tundrisphaera lichenicola TaxID=2029860 RepID=UPI003EBD5CBE
MGVEPIETRRRPRILFVAEAVTLAHVARLLALAERLDPREFEIFFASDRRFGEPWLGKGFEVRAIRSIEPSRFLEALAAGSPLYDAATLESYLSDDLALIEAVRPAAVVGDFRLTLSISARMARVPYLALVNAYWSPYAEKGFPMPELPISRFLGVRMATPLFRLAQPMAFAVHARPLDHLRKSRGLPPLGGDLRRTYTDADWTLYADVPELVPTSQLPPNHIYLGPIDWSPGIAPPIWWSEIQGEIPTIYATMGSSGRPGLLSKILDALADLPVQVIAASAGKLIEGVIPPNARIEPYLPGKEAASRSMLVICNGGSPTTQQALGIGIPVLGLAENLDQHLNMRGIESRGAGVLIRSEDAGPSEIRSAVLRMMEDPSFGSAARELAQIFGRYDAHSRFRSVLEQALEADQAAELRART